jgi:hypothetical protein
LHGHFRDLRVTACEDDVLVARRRGQCIGSIGELDTACSDKFLCRFQLGLFDLWVEGHCDPRNCGTTRIIVDDDRSPMPGNIVEYEHMVRMVEAVDRSRDKALVAT